MMMMMPLGKSSNKTSQNYNDMLNNSLSTPPPKPNRVNPNSTDLSPIHSVINKKNDVSKSNFETNQNDFENGMNAIIINRDEIDKTHLLNNLPNAQISPTYNKTVLIFIHSLEI